MSEIIEILKLIGQFFGAIYKFIQTNPLFTTNLFNFILVIIFFAWLLIAVINVPELLDKKSRETIKSITDAENKKSEAKKYLDDTQDSLKNVDNDVENIISEAKEVALNIEKKSAEKLEEEIENIKNREEIIRIAQFSKAKEEVSSVIASAAIKISEEYIKNSLDETAHRELIMNFIDDLDDGVKL